MRLLALSIATSFLLMEACLAQTIDVKPSPQDIGLPVYRPALVGNGPDALINRIDGKALVKNGQAAAALMFACIVRKTGDVSGTAIYQATPGSKPLEEELNRCLNGVKFIPAIYKQAPVDAIFFGTVVFGVIEGKPRLRIFSNQEKEELKKETDFIAPQPFFGNPSNFDGWRYPTGNKVPIAMNGEVQLSLEVTQEGILKAITVLGEQPPLVGFGEAVALDTSKARFIPAFRGGKPVASKVILRVRLTKEEELFHVQAFP